MQVPGRVEADSLDINEFSVIPPLGPGRGFSFPGADDLEAGLELVGEAPAQGSADGRKEQEEAHGVGKESRREEDSSREEDEEAVEGFPVGQAAFSRRLSEVGHGPGALRPSKGRTDDGGEKNDEKGRGEPDVRTEGQEKIKFCDGYDDK